MPIQFTCPHCGSQTNVDDRFAGQTGPCKNCGATVTVPGTPSPFAPGPPPRTKSSSTPVLVIGLGCGLVALLVVPGILIALLLPAIQAAREAARRSQCTNNLKQIGLALQTYADINKAFPPAYIADENGKPMHSWRVLILPYMEEKSLYDRYNFDEPWDGPNNSQLAALMPQAYACPTDSAAGQSSGITSYAAISGPGTIFDGDTPANFATIKDGTSMTIAVAEATGAGIHWMEPRDLDIGQMTFSVNGSANDISSHHPGGANVVFADGHAAHLDNNVPAQTLRALMTKAGGEPVTGNF